MSPTQVVVRRIRLVEQGELGVLPVELARFNDHTANCSTVASNPLGERVHNNISAVLQRLENARRREGGVNDQRELVLVSNLGDCGDVAEIQRRVADGFHEEAASARSDGLLEVLGVACIDEVTLDVVRLREDVCEHGVGAAVQVGRGHDLVAML